jgi:membrane-bound serine protease (ClpP class)
MKTSLVRKFVLWAVLGTLVLATAAWALKPTGGAKDIKIAEIEGTIDPAVADYLTRVFEQSPAATTACIIIRLNTPGGLITSLEKIVNLLLNSRVPTVVYVAPSGADAASAGTLIALAANFAVMHPGATIGAVHPVGLFPSPPPNPEGDNKKPAPLSVEDQKLVNFISAKARTIALLRGRNADWAEQAVRVSRSTPAPEALKLHVIDALQPTLADLIAWLDGRSAEVEGGKVTLHTRGLRLVEIPPTARERFLHQLADSNLLLIFIVLAAMGIMFELKNPGGVLPGVVGVISALLALYAMSVLPVTTSGVALLLFGILLFILDVKLPSHGILTLGGIVSFVVGGLMLIDTHTGVARVSLQVVITLAILLGAFFLFIVGAAVAIHRRRPTTGREGLLGAHGKVLTALSAEKEGEIFIVGEEWRARPQEGSIAPGEKVEVVAVEGLTLVVKQIK